MLFRHVYSQGISLRYLPCPYAMANHLHKHVSFEFRRLIDTDGARGGVVVKALRYKPEDRGFDSRLYHWNFSVT